MNNLKNEGYILGNEYYLPERVFFCNLLVYCRSKTGDLLDEIYSMMGNRIEENVSAVLEYVEVTEKNKGRKASRTAHMLPLNFRKFVDKESKLKLSKKDKDDSRDSNYLLSRCYDKISSVVCKTTQAKTKLAYTASSVKEDRRTIDQFRDIYEGANPLSERDFNRIQSAIGVPVTKRSKQIKSFSDNQDIVVRFAIEEVIPSLISKTRGPMLSFFASKDWRDVVCKIVNEKGIPDTVIYVNEVTDKELSEYMNACFMELKAIADLPQKQQDISQIGSVLIKIYNRINHEHISGTIWGAQYCPSCESIKRDPQKKSELTYTDNKQYEHDELISTHILNWLEYHNFKHQDIPEFMESIGKVIDKIRPQVLAQIGTAFTMDEFRTFKRKDESCNSLFAWLGCEELLRLLLSTISSVPIILFKHHENGRST